MADEELDPINLMGRLDQSAMELTVEAAGMAKLPDGQLPAIMTALLAIEARLAWLGVVIASQP